MNKCHKNSHSHNLVLTRIAWHTRLIAGRIPHLPDFKAFVCQDSCYWLFSWPCLILKWKCSYSTVGESIFPLAQMSTGHGTDSLVDQKLDKILALNTEPYDSILKHILFYKFVICFGKWTLQGSWIQRFLVKFQSDSCHLKSMCVEHASFERRGESYS